jgi:hypothetical protein
MMIDDIEQIDFDWANAPTAESSPTLIIEPNTAEGLALHHVQHIHTRLKI